MAYILLYSNYNPVKLLRSNKGILFWCLLVVLALEHRTEL